jgi:hypothetical protein
MEQQPKTKKHSLSTIVITVLAIMIILALGGLFYYYSLKSIPASPGESNGTANVVKKPVPQVVPTNVIKFSAPDVLPDAKKQGYCWVNSVADPFRKDAWRCMVENSIFDPCFETSQKGAVFCQADPTQPDSFLINLTKPLPKPVVPQTVQDNWGWFVKLKDGTYCSPFTGTRPFFGTGPDAQVAYYGCHSNNQDEQIVLLGDLAAGNVWTADEAILTKTNTNWTIKSSQKVDIDTVWQ